MNSQPLPSFFIPRLAAVALGWCVIAATSFGDVGSLEDRPYQPSASVVKGTVAALSDSSEEVVALAVSALGDWHQATAAAEVAKLLGANTPAAVRMEALLFFRRLGPQALPQIGEVIKNTADADPNIRLAVLGAIFDAQASAANVDTIRPLLDDARGDVRAAAAKCLGQAGKAAAAHRQASLDAVTSSRGSELKVAALQALVSIGGLTVEDLEKVVPLLHDRDAEVRVATAALIFNVDVALKAAGTVPEEKLAKVRATMVAQFEKEPPEIQAAMIEEAGKDKASVEASVTNLGNRIRTGPPETKAASLRVLGKAGEAALPQVPLIIEQAHDADSIVRAAAIACLGSIGSAAVKPNVAIVANSLLDVSDAVRSEALLALPAGGDALRNLPFKMRDVYAPASPEVRATLIKAMPIIVRVIGLDEDGVSRGRAALTDANPDIRIAMAFVMSELGAKDGAVLQPELLALLKDPDSAVRGAATISLRSFATDAAAKQKLRAALLPLLADRDAEVRWAALDTFHDLDPGADPAVVAAIAARLKDEEEAVRSSAVRALGAAGAAAKPHLVAAIRFFFDDPAVTPYGAARAVAEMGPLSPQELASLFYPIYVYPDLLPIVRLTAYGSSAGDRDGEIIIRLLGRSRTAARDVVAAGEVDHAIALLQETLKASLIHEKMKPEIEARIAELKAGR